MRTNLQSRKSRRNYVLSLLCILLISVVLQSTVSAQTPLRRPISPDQPIWLIHIDTWNYADPEKIIDLVPDDIKPFVVMNISLSISHDVATSRFKVAEYGYEIATSWVRSCAENQMWCMVQPSSGGFSQFSDYDLSVYEEFFQEYPNFIGFNYAEQFWGFDDPNDPLSRSWIDRMAHFANLLELANQYGGYLSVSWCGNQWSPVINPIGMMKRNAAFAEACRDYTENYILMEKYTQQGYQSDMESVCLGAYLSGYSGQYGCRYDDTGWTDENGDHNDFTMATAGAVHLEHVMLTGQTVLDGPELIWTQCFRETNRVATSDGYSTRNWKTFPQFDNVSVDIFRKIIDGTIRIPTRQEVVGRTKYVIINDVNSGTADEIYSSPETLFEGLYRMDVDGNYENNKYFFKKTGRYPTIPTVFQLDDQMANSFQYKINRSDYSNRWPNVSAKVNEMNNQFAAESTGDIYAGRHENGWVVYNPYKSGQTASGSISLKYNTCNSMEFSLSQYTAGVVKEYSNNMTVYLSNYDNVLNTDLKTDIIKIYGSSECPTYTWSDRASHQPSELWSDWTNGVWTLHIYHNGSLDININCSGTATGRLTNYTEATITTPNAPVVYTGPRQHEGECFDYKNIAGITTSGFNENIRNYTGQGYLNFGTNSSAGIRDIVDMQSAGTYPLNIRYAVTGANINTVAIYINGAYVAAPTYTATPSLSDWNTVTQNIDLNAGQNTIELVATGSAPASIHFDNIVVGDENNNPVGCIGETTLPNGIYTISPKVSGKCLDVYNFSTEDGGDVVQWSCTGAENQQWIVSQSNGLYTFTNVHSDKCLDVTGASFDDGANIQQWTCHGGSAQQFCLTDRGDGYYSIINYNSGKGLDVESSSTDDGANIQQYSYWAAEGQQFAFTPVGNAPGNEVWLEAECGIVGSLWNVSADAAASNGEYVTVQSGNNSTGSAPTDASGQITYSFDITEDGTFTIWGRVIAPTYDDDSYWVSVDGGAWLNWNGITASTTWTWDDIDSYSLTAGSHTLTIAFREDGTQLDKIFITNTGTTPSGEGATANNCISCEPDEITPYVQVDGGSWQQTSNISVTSGSTIVLGPQPLSVGSWSWSGCGTSGSSREQIIIPVSSCIATAIYTNACGAQSTRNFNISVEGGEVWLEAECGSVGSLWDINTDGTASNGGYVTIQPGNTSTGSVPTDAGSQISYTFNVSESNTYTIWGRVIAPSPDDDSFWISVDGGSWLNWNGIAASTTWTWDDIGSYALNAGQHTLTVAYREDGTKLDKICIASSGSTPSGEGGTATNCIISEPVTIQENTTGFCSVDGTIDNNNDGYTGDGFANTNNATGNGIEWNVYFPTSGTKTFTFRYASSTDRPGNLMIDGLTVVFNINFPSTGSWITWNTVSADADVNAGTYLVRLEAIGDEGLGNIDYLETVGIPQGCATLKSTLITGIAEPGDRIDPNRGNALVISAEYYTLMGQRLEEKPTAPGIYIVKKTLSNYQVVVAKEWIEGLR